MYASVKTCKIIMNMHEIDLAVGFYWFLLDLLVSMFLNSIGHIGFYWSHWVLLVSFVFYWSYRFLLVLSVLLVLLVFIGRIGFYWSYWLLFILVSMGAIGFYWFLMVRMVSIGFNSMGLTETNRLQQKPLETNIIFLMVSIGVDWIFDLGVDVQI